MTQPTYGPLPGPSYDLRGDLRRSSAATAGLSELEAYYVGDQRLHYLSMQLQRANRPLVINIPRLVVDSIEDRLDVEGFRIGGSAVADDDLYAIWQANDLDEWSQQAHLDSLIYGRSFVLGWEDPEADDRPSLTVESATQLTVDYDPAKPSPLGGRGVVTRAVKRWVQDGEQYATVYLPDRILRFVAPVATVVDRPESWRSRGPEVINPYGLVPVVPFPNRPRLAHPLGESEMTDVIPVADAINELADTMMVTARYYATPRRWATGIDLDGENDDRTREIIRQRWSQAEADRVWTSDSTSTNFGQFPEAQLDNFTTAIDMLTARAAALSGLPPHYFGQVGENPASADALRSSEASLVKRALRKQRVFGGAWERVMRLSLLIRDGQIPDAALSMETIWASPETPTVAQKADAAVKLLAAGAITKRQVREDIGYTQTQIARMEDEDDAAALGPVRVQLTEAARLQREGGLSQQAAYAAVGLLQAAQAMGSTPS